MKENIKSVLFVSSGGICRSAFARAILHQKKPSLIVSSAAINKCDDGGVAASNAIKTASIHGLNIAEFTVEPLDLALGESFDLIVGFDALGIKAIQDLGLKSVVKLGNFGLGGEDIPDPFFTDNFDVFVNVFAMVNQGVEGLVSEFFKGNS